MQMGNIKVGISYRACERPHIFNTFRAPLHIPFHSEENIWDSCIRVPFGKIILEHNFDFYLCKNLRRQQSIEYGNKEKNMYEIKVA